MSAKEEGRLIVLRESAAYEERRNRKKAEAARKAYRGARWTEVTDLMAAAYDACAGEWEHLLWKLDRGDFAPSACAKEPKP